MINIIPFPLNYIDWPVALQNNSLFVQQAAAQLSNSLLDNFRWAKKITSNIALSYLSNPPLEYL